MAISIELPDLPGFKRTTFRQPGRSLFNAQERGSWLTPLRFGVLRKATAFHKPTQLARTEVIEPFDDRDGFVTFHQEMADFKKSSALVENDYD